MNRITNVRLHITSLQEYIDVCDILSSLGVSPPTRHAYYEFVFIYDTNATCSDSSSWFNAHHNAFMETSDYIKQKGLNKPQFLLKRKKL